MTAQTPDTILLDGQEWLLLGTPLDALLATNGLARRFVAPDTANVRGYLATWRVDPDGRLFLDAVTATVRGLGSGTQTIHGSAVLRGMELPLAADFVTGRLRLARGNQVRHVHSGFDSVWEDELLLEVERGQVGSRRSLAPPSAMGSAGPYRLHEPLLPGLSGGGFGQVMAATDLDGRPLVAKAPLPRGGGNRTEMWLDTPAGRRPAHLAAQVFRADPGGSRSIEIGPELTASVLRQEAQILERDGGRLLPRSLGLWPHDPSGLDVLVMERLAGQPPRSPADVLAVLTALADAVDRGTFDAHGDVKPEHVFLADGVVRMCDPAPRFPDPQLFGLTPAYNPRAWRGPAADVAACATILRYLPTAAEAGHPGWRWCAAVLDQPAPPAWVHSHRAALTELRRDLDGPALLPPPGWSLPPFPGNVAAPPAGGPTGPPGPWPATLPAAVGGPAPAAWCGPPPPPPPPPGAAWGYSFDVLALVLSASVIEPVEPQDGQPVGVFVPICDHAVDALTAILWALGPTIDRHARQFGIPPLEPAGMTLMVRRATRAGTPGLLAHTLSMPVVAVGPPTSAAPAEHAVAAAWNAVAATRLSEACDRLAEAVQRLAVAPDRRRSAEVIDIAQRIGGSITVLRGHLERALEDR